MNPLENMEVEYLNGINTRTIEMGFGEIVQQLITEVNRGIAPAKPCVIPNGTPVNAVKAKATLVVSGEVEHRETVSIGDDKYEFLTDEAQIVSEEGNIPVDIESHAAKAEGTLTINIQPIAGDKMTIGNKEYIFVPVGTDTADGEISIGADVGEAQANIVAAINGTDEVNTPHPLVYAEDFANDICPITAYAGGTQGNDIDTTSVFTAGTNKFAKSKLENGISCSAANAVATLILAINDEGTEAVNATVDGGTSIIIEANVAGVLANSIAVAETMENGAFSNADETLKGGIDGTVGVKGGTMFDGTYLYICTAENSVSGGNWKRISLGAAY